MANIAVCARLANETTVEPILHVCARDKAFLGLVAHLLGAHALGLRNLVIITGDPPKMGDYPFSTPVYDVDSVARALREIDLLSPGRIETREYIVARPRYSGTVDARKAAAVM